MTKKKVLELKNGVYRIFWREGGSSLAAVGITDSGDRWMAPTNWTALDEKYPKVAVTHVWREVKSAVLLIAA
jgi:hypothetical protein